MTTYRTMFYKPEYVLFQNISFPVPSGMQFEYSGTNNLAYISQSVQLSVIQLLRPQHQSPNALSWIQFPCLRIVSFWLLEQGSD